MMETNKEMDLREMFLIFAKKWWLILLLTLVGSGMAYGITVKYVSPVYEGKTVLYIGQEGSGLGSIGISLGQLEANSQLIIDYKQLALTRLVIDAVIKNTGVNISYADFENNTVIETVKDSRLFTVGFRHPDPVIAQLVSTELSKQLTLAVSQIVGVENIRILDQALLPQTPVAPNVMLNTLIGGILGFLASLFIIAIMFMMDDTVKNENDIENLLGVTVMGNTPEFKAEVK